MAAASSSSSSSASAAAAPKSAKRLQKEFLKLHETPLPFATVSLVGDDICQWLIKLRGPAGSPFEGGTFQISMRFPDSYPIKPPQASFVTPVYHPSASMKSNGQICADVFENDW